VTLAPGSRRNARHALAELFLDTALDDDDFARLAKTLIDSGLPVDELEHIYADELAPVLHGNLKAPTGEWAGFDSTWLESEIAKRAPRMRQGSVLSKLRRAWQLRETRADWQRLKRMIESQHAANS
jgi:hypothetical protein